MMDYTRVISALCPRHQTKPGDLANLVATGWMVVIAARSTPVNIARCLPGVFNENLCKHFQITIAEKPSVSVVC